MNWFNGNIAEAVAQSKAKNAIFVVYVEGKDENTQKLTQFLNDASIRTKLESDDFVAIKIESGSQAYTQFASIYQMVPVPSIFFIGKSGTPLEIGTGIIASVEELAQKIDKVLTASGKSSASSSFIATEQASAGQLPTTSAAALQPQDSDEIVCKDGVCYKKPKDVETPNESAIKPQDTTPAAEKPTVQTDDANARLEETRKLLEEKRRERVEQERELEKERELRRRREGKEVQNVQHWQKEQELKELKENIRRERQEEHTARERIRAQIAADRAERAQKFAVDADSAAATSNARRPASPPPPQATNNNSNAARLQFRFASGNNKTNNFNPADTLGVVRAYVKSELLPGTGIKDFFLATTYPKRELTLDDDVKTLVELGLFPSAVILVISKEGSSPTAIIARSGGIINIATTLFWALLSPVFAVYGYLKNITRRGGGDGGNVGANKRANEEQGINQDVAKRRNLDRFLSGPSTSRDAAEASTGFNANNGDQKAYRRVGGSNVHRLTDNRKDSDDENATWNGNSTQQQ